MKTIIRLNMEIIENGFLTIIKHKKYIFNLYIEQSN
jgi:hypothetical protein